MSLELFLLLNFILLIILAVFIVPILIQVTRMLASVTALINTFNESGKALMTEATQTVHTTNSIVATVDETVKTVSEALSAVKDIGAGLKSLGKTLKDSEGYITSFLKQITVIGTTIKTALGLIAKGIKKKGGQDG